MNASKRKFLTLSGLALASSLYGSQTSHTKSKEKVADKNTKPLFPILKVLE